jgi:hypothetical protein
METGSIIELVFPRIRDPIPNLGIACYRIEKAEPLRINPVGNPADGLGLLLAPFLNYLTAHWL